MKTENIIFYIIVLFLSSKVWGQGKQDFSPLLGRWDLTVDVNGKALPGWLEVKISGKRTLVGRVLLFVGSPRPISKIEFGNGKFSFSVPPQWEKGEKDLRFEGSVEENVLKGKVTYVDDKVFSWTGSKAPSLQRSQSPEWAAPLQLFDGKDLKGWYATGENQWIVEAGLLKSPKSGANLVTDQVFTDFKLHIEFRYPKGGNSGVYLRGRYEVQVSDSKGKEALDDQFGAVYGQLEPNEMVARDPGEWQSFDIILIGRRVTVVANGIPVITDQVIPGITGEALNSKEGEAGPIMLQGDHEPIEFRNIVITPVKK